jgi:hypothetical protein
MPQNALDVLGYWWLPEHSDHKVPGRLTWDAEEGGRLELLGELHPLELHMNLLADGEIQPYRIPRTKLENQFPVIHGERREQRYTLLNSFSLNGVGLHDWKSNQKTSRSTASSTAPGTPTRSTSKPIGPSSTFGT